jgi:hypothetical protein
MNWTLLCVVAVLVCVIIYFNCKQGKNVKNVDGFTGKVVDTFPDGICKVIVSTDRGIIKIMAHNKINASEGDFVIMEQYGDMVYAAKKTGYWNNL